MAAHGITPAWAGKSRHSGKRWPHPWDHPRVGGEKLRMGFLRGLVLGSPPHGRGKADILESVGHILGITPAWAGKSRHSGKRWPHPWDHPRVGGEKMMPASLRTPPTGSPPRGRGKDTADIAKNTKNRITPAWAGKSHSPCLPYRCTTDHPRVGGEKICFHFFGDL